MEMFSNRPPEELVAALVKAELLETHDIYRLIVHDWSNHSDDTTDARLARQGQRYADGSIPRMTRLSNQERKSLINKWGWHESGPVVAQKATKGHGVASSATKSPYQQPEPEPEPIPEPAAVTEPKAVTPIAAADPLPDSVRKTLTIAGIGAKAIREIWADTRKHVPDRTADEVVELFNHEWRTVSQRRGLSNPAGLMIKTFGDWFNAERIAALRQRKRPKLDQHMSPDEQQLVRAGSMTDEAWEAEMRARGMQRKGMAYSGDAGSLFAVGGTKQ
jgi:hypothetical protein